jgi:hypothetical protein
MKLVARIFKWIGISVLTLVLLLTIVVIMRQNLTFEAPYPNVHSSSDSAVIAKGEYLFYGPAHCMDCHSNKAGNPLLADEDVTPSGGYLTVRLQDCCVTVSAPMEERYLISCLFIIPVMKILRQSYLICVPFRR